MKIKPNPNKKVNEIKIEVFDPIRGDFIPSEGREVPEIPYWIRRIQVGDVVRTEKIEPVEAAEPEDAPAEEPVEAAEPEEVPAKASKKSKKASAEAEQTSNSGE